MDGRLSLGPDGRLLVARPALPGEADRLRSLAGLAVPSVVDDGDELVVTWAPPERAPVAAVLAEVASTVAAAHERGVAHGPFAAEHLRVGVVDGWAGGDPADDVASLGRLLLDGDPLPPHLDALARRMVADDPAARPSMRAVADAVAPPPPAPPRARREVRVPAWLPAVAAVPVAVVATVLVGGGGEPARPDRPAPATTSSTTTTAAVVARPYEGVSPP